ncbi:ABC transporter permease [Diplocloster hominis]|uniref:ABC transporter permease n=1 Tax=Diplocloster hominis TaxID=3079010 RepID=UPI0031BACE97
MKRIKEFLGGFLHYKALLYELVVRDIKVRYKRSFLGLLWTIVNPLLTMAVMTLVFSHLFRFEIENFTIYFLTANIMFTFFTESTTNGLHSIVDNGNLIKKVYIPKYLFPVSKVMSGVVNLFFSFIALIIMMIVTGSPFHLTMLLTPIVMIYLIMFSMGLALILSAFMVFFRDIAQLYGICTLLWMYLTPIFYPVSLLKDNAPWALSINPMYYYIDYFRMIVLEGGVPSLRMNIICFLISFIVLLVGLVIFYKKQDRYILYI